MSWVSQGGLPEEVGFKMQEEFKSREAGRGHGNRIRTVGDRDGG